MGPNHKIPKGLDFYQESIKNFLDRGQIIVKIK